MAVKYTELLEHADLTRLQRPRGPPFGDGLLADGFASEQQENIPDNKTAAFLDTLALRIVTLLLRRRILLAL